jgi:hypothetical protein
MRTSFSAFHFHTNGPRCLTRILEGCNTLFNFVVYNREVNPADCSRIWSKWVEVLGHAVQSDFVCGSNFRILLCGGEGQAKFYAAVFFPDGKSKRSKPRARLQR